METVETHISTVFFVGDRAYKLKKPITAAFIDLSTPAKRKKACEREVALNRRLSPDIHLGVASVIGPEGSPCDYLTVMKRLSPDRKLSRLLGEPDVDDQLRKLAHLIAAFHSGAERSELISHEGTSERVRVRWRENLRETDAFERLIPRQMRQWIGALAGRYIDGREALFERRCREGSIVDGHGDLLADDIFCLDDGPRVLDCLEFDDRMRYLDVLDDVAFLAMDLERLGRIDLARRWVALYREMSNDRGPQSLIDHYIAFRAYVRAKVAAMRAQQGVKDKVKEVSQCLLIATEHLRRAEPTLLIVGGVPGSGKSTVARGISEKLGWTILGSDQTRKEIFGTSRARRGQAPYKGGTYTPALTDQTYEELLRRARCLLSLGESVIIDATWARLDHRHQARRSATTTRSRFIQLRCDSPLEICQQRIARRTDDSISDATPDIAASLAVESDVWTGALAVDSSQASPDAIQKALEGIELLASNESGT